MNMSVAVVFQASVGSLPRHNQPCLVPHLACAQGAKSMQSSTLQAGPAIRVAFRETCPLDRIGLLVVSGP